MGARETKCAACIFGAMHKRPWHSHVQVNKVWPVLSITKLAQCDSLRMLLKLFLGSMATKYIIIIVIMVALLTICS